VDGSGLFSRWWDYIRALAALKVTDSEETFQDQIQDPQQKDDNRDLVDAVHHPDVDVRRTGRIFPAEEISAYFTKGKKLFPSAFLPCIFSVRCFHVNTLLNDR